MFDVIAFDADDTLWHNETLYLAAQNKFKQLLAKYQRPALIEEELHMAETRNVHVFGYGIKGFALSMIEAAVRLSEGQVRGHDIQVIIDIAREMLEAPVRLFDRVEETVAALSRSHRLLLITKGDLLDQGTKISRSGLADYFAHVEIVSEKNTATYQAILAKHAIHPQHFLMVGNSLRSDILPVIAIGGQAVYIPYDLTWAHEKAVDDDGDQGEYFVLEHISLLPDLVRHLSDA